MAKMVRCARCKGTGAITSNPGALGSRKKETCPACGGAGKVKVK